MGSSRRRRGRRGAARASQQPTPPPPRRGLKATIDSFGGFLTLGAIIVGVVVVGALIFFNRPGGDGGSVGGGDFEPRQRPAASDGRLLGDSGAPIRIVAFEDFSCPHCRDFTRETEPLIEEEYVDEGLASIEFRHLAILGADSERAAAAAECAADQNLFWDYHDILFLRQGGAGWASNGNLKDFAREVDDALGGNSFDLHEFDSCVDSGAKELVISAATDESTGIFQDLTGRASTPSFLINGQPLQGAQPIEVFRAMLDDLAPAGGG